MLFVTATTLTAGSEMVGRRFPAMISGGQVAKGALNLALTIFVMACVAVLLLQAVVRWVLVARGVVPVRREAVPAAAVAGASSDISAELPVS
jgi:hypothetical protein